MGDNIRPSLFELPLDQTVKSVLVNRRHRLPLTKRRQTYRFSKTNKQPH